MSEALFDVFGVPITFTGAYAILSAIIMLLFMNLWLIGRKKKTDKENFAGQVINGAGFGLLPALAVLKAFQEMGTGKGSKVFVPLPEIRWMTVNGYFQPGRIETMAALGCFMILCLWLIIRKNDFTDKGDLLLIAVCIWSAIRLITEDLRAEPRDQFRYMSCVTMSACMILWIVKREKTIHTPVKAIADIAATAACIAVIILTAKSVLSFGSEIGNFAVKSGCAVLLLVLTLSVGGEVRRSNQKMKQDGADSRHRQTE